MTPNQLDAAYGFQPGTVRGWIKGRVIPEGLTPARLEHAAVVAYVSRPCLAAFTGRGWADMFRAANAEHGAVVRDSLANAPEGPCSTAPTTDVPSAPAAA